MSATQQVLLVGGHDADAALLAQALRSCGRAAEVVRVKGTAEATRLLSSRPPLLCLLVSLEDGCESAPWWRKLLVGYGLDVPLLAVGELAQEPLITSWLSDGANDWLFRPHLAGLCAVLARLDRERARVESAVEHSERRFKDLFENANDVIALYRVEADQRIVVEDINAAAERMSGISREHTVGKAPSELLGSPAAERLEQRLRDVIRTRATQVVEHPLQLPDRVRWLSTATVPLLDERGEVRRVATLSRDITTAREGEALHRNLEAQVAESQKNEALARLASHIAHDVNNLLTVIVAHAQRLQLLDGKPAEVAENILQATSRGRELTQQVLTFGRRRPAERKAVDLGPLVRETLKLLEPTAGQVKLRELVGARVPRVLGDASQLHQMLTNLCTNALRAMPTGEGTLTVTLEAIDVDFAFASRHPPLEAGRWVRLSVTDTGVGMDEATSRRIFEPFFSTSRDGSGTGLGLAVVQSIVQGHDGAVVVESEPGKGSRFHVFLRSLQDDTSRPGSGQHLMLVDDHPGMARVSARLLETLGYRTTVFDDPREALKAFSASPDGFDAVLTDLSMPQMSGEDFTSSLRQLRPQVPVIVSSGMASELDEETRQRLGIAAVLVKPWRLEEAVAALQRALG